MYINININNMISNIPGGHTGNRFEPRGNIRPRGFGGAPYPNEFVTDDGGGGGGDGWGSTSVSNLVPNTVYVVFAAAIAVLAVVLMMCMCFPTSFVP